MGSQWGWDQFEKESWAFKVSSMTSRRKRKISYFLDVD